MVKRLFSYFLFLVLVAGVYGNAYGISDEQKKKFLELKSEKLKEALKLDDKTAEKLIPVVSKYDEQKWALRKEVRADMKTLRSSLETAGDDELSKLIAKIRANKQAIYKLKDDEFEEIKGILTVKQQAQFMIFNKKLAKELKKKLRGMKGKRGKHRMGEDKL